MRAESIYKMMELKNNFQYFASLCLKIRTKNKGVSPFLFNKAQILASSLLDRQLAKTGKVRALILKGRQQGMSTLIAGRFYHKLCFSRGSKAFILCHRKDATDNLFKIIKRFHENNEPLLKPSTGVSNAKSLYFDQLDNGYSLGTSGAGTVGRSETLQYLHGSEVAFWENTDEIQSGLMQAVPETKGTEIILESTANGMGNMFHKLCMDALNGDNDYIVIFIPWFLDDDYSSPIPLGFELTDDEMVYKNCFNLSTEQIVWRRSKIKILGEDKFRQEYPSNVQEAFEVSGEDQLIDPKIVRQSIINQVVVNPEDDLIVGVDPARSAKGDSTVIIGRTGRAMSFIKAYKGKNTMEIVGELMQMIRTMKIYRINIDVGGNGAGIIDRLHELGYKDMVQEINFGWEADEKNRYANKRAEIWQRTLDWLPTGKILDDPQLVIDLCGVWKKYDSTGRLLLEPKEITKKRIGRSPDYGDALAVTFAINYPSSAFRKSNIPQVTVANSNWSVF